MIESLLDILFGFKNFLLLLIGFTFVIFVHELGHFAVAKWVGIKCDQFAIGFGHAALSWRKGIGWRIGTSQAEYEKRIADGTPESELGETEYRLNWIPFGGYVKMMGQDDLDMAHAATDPRSYSAKPVWARTAVISAGVIMNLIFAVIMFVTCFMVGLETQPPIIGAVAPDRHAAQVMPENAEALGITVKGIQPGDVVKMVNGHEARSFRQVATAMALARSGRPVQLDIDRDGTPLTFNVQIHEEGTDRELLDLGMSSLLSARIDELKDENDEAIFGYMLNELGIEEGGLAPMASIQAVNGTKVSNFVEIANAVRDAHGEMVSLTWTPVDLSEPKETSAPPETKEISVYPVPQIDVVMAEGSAWLHVLGLAPPIVIEKITRAEAIEAGLQPGDIIARLAKTEWPRREELFGIVKAHKGQDLQFVVLRGGERISLSVPVSWKGQVGLYPALGINTNIIVDTAPQVMGEGEVGADHPLYSLPPGSRLMEVNGNRVETYREIILALQESVENEPSNPVKLRWKLPTVEAQEVVVQWHPTVEEQMAIASHSWGLGRLEGFFAPSRITIITTNPVEAVKWGFQETWEMVFTTYLTLDRLFRGTVKAKDLKGPIGIADLGTKVAGQGLMHLIFFLALINVNLAVLNFLPIPILDGGLFVFLMVEKIKGSPVSDRIQSFATLAGLFIIGSLFLIVSYNDIATLIRGFIS